MDVNKFMCYDKIILTVLHLVLDSTTESRSYDIYVRDAHFFCIARHTFTADN